MIMIKQQPLSIAQLEKTNPAIKRIRKTKDNNKSTLTL